MPFIRRQQRYINGKPNLVIAHPKDNIDEYPFSIPAYKESYTDFAKLAEKKFNVFFVRNKKSYRGQGSFINGYLFSNGDFKKYNKKVFAKVVYNKTGLRLKGGRRWSIVNVDEVYKLTSNKFTSYKIFKKYMKPTYRIHNKRDFNKYIKLIKCSWVVYKPVRGAEGKGIVIGPKKTIAKKMKKFNGILQEFIDTSGGVPGVCKKLHDMRILIMNGKIIQAYVRMPKSGSYLANVARGGNLKEIKKSSIPRTALKIAREIDRKYFRKFKSRIYAIDFGFEKGNPYIFELNPQPGLPYKKWPMYYRTWHRELLNTLYNAIRK